LTAIESDNGPLAAASARAFHCVCILQEYQAALRSFRTLHRASLQPRNTPAPTSARQRDCNPHAARATRRHEREVPESAVSSARNPQIKRTDCVHPVHQCTTTASVQVVSTLPVAGQYTRRPSRIALLLKRQPLLPDPWPLFPSPYETLCHRRRFRPEAMIKERKVGKLWIENDDGS
jgi:hypothetical protein